MLARDEDGQEARQTIMLFTIDAIIVFQAPDQGLAMSDKSRKTPDCGVAALHQRPNHPYRQTLAHDEPSLLGIGPGKRSKLDCHCYLAYLLLPSAKVKNRDPNAPLLLDPRATKPRPCQAAP